MATLPSASGVNVILSYPLAPAPPPIVIAAPFEEIISVLSEGTSPPAFWINANPSSSVIGFICGVSTELADCELLILVY